MGIEVNATEQIIEVNATGSTIDINVSSQTVDVNATTSVIEVTASYNPGINLPIGGATGQVLKKQSNTDYDTYWAADEKGVPYIGATGDVDLGEYELKAGQIELDQSPTGTAGVAVTRWNDTIGSTETTLKGGNVVLKNGVDLIARVVNKVNPNTTLTKAAYQAVKISGAQGQRLAVALAQANNDNNSADTLGLVTETIPTNQEGFIMTVGNLEGINTTGSLQGETWADGDVLYLSPTIAGRLTNIKPNGSTGHIVVIGYVEYAHQNNGKIYVKIMNGWELDELHNVFISSPANNDALIYESATSLWKNKSIATALGYTPGTVSSVALSVPTGLVVTSGSPITTSGTIAVGLQSGYSIPTTVKQGNWDDAYTFVSAFPSQTGNSGKYLTTDGSTLSWGTVSTANIYNSDGTLTGNRTVTLGANTLNFSDRFKFLVNAQGSIDQPYLEIGSTTAIGGRNQYGILRLSRSAGPSASADINPYTQDNIFIGQSVSNIVLGSVGVRIGNDASLGYNNTNLQVYGGNSSGADHIVFSAANVGRLLLISRATNGKVWNLTTDNTGDFIIGQTASVTNVLRLFGSTSNITIGGATDAGYKLDVQGTGRFTNDLAITSIVGNSIVSSATSYFLNVSNASGNLLAQFNNNATSAKILDGNVQFTTGTTINSVSHAAAIIGVSHIYGSTGGANGGQYFAAVDNAANSTRYMVGHGSKGLKVELTPNNTWETSALLQVSSTTKGFLQPRMTGTQRDAIVSPATGLSVYNTTTNTSDFYNGTSWVSLAAGNIYTADGTLTGNRTVTMGGNTLSFVKGDNLTGVFVSYLANNLTAGVGIGYDGVRATGSNANVDLNLYSKGSGTILSSSKVNFSNSNLVFGNVNIQYGTINSDIAELTLNYYSSSGGGIASFRNTTICNGKTGVIAKVFGDTGNLVLQTGGTITDAGYKLDVQGTARVNNALTIGGGQMVLNYSSPNAFIDISGAGWNYELRRGGTTFQKLWGAAGRHVFTDYTQNTTDTPSAVVSINSTVGGFLPPRMTETQKNAISTPATGLIVYQTDGTEGLYERTSSAWRLINASGSGGGITRSVNNISTTTTAGSAASTDYVYLISGTTTLTLPTAAGNTNRYTLKNVGTNTVTINTTSSQTIDGSTSITMAVRYTALDVISDGTNWNII